MERRRRRIARPGATLAAAVAALALAAGPLAAQDRITLKLAGVLSPSHYIETTGTKYWMDRVTAETGGRVQFEYFPAEQLGKAGDMLGLAQAGAVDIGEQPVAYVADKLPLSGIVELPGLFATACAGTAAYHAVVQPGKLVYDDDIKPAGLHVLMAVTLSPYKLLTSRRPVRTLADFAGLKLRTTGGAMELIAIRLGAVSVRMASPDIYQSFSRGTLDGVFFAFLGAKPYDLQTVARYATTGFSFGTAAVTWLIGNRAWDKLPADIQRVMLAEGERAERNFCAYADAHEDAEEEALGKGGMTMIALDQEQRAALTERLAPVAEQWAAGLDRRGKPATQALAQFKDALAKP